VRDAGKILKRGWNRRLAANSNHHMTGCIRDLLTRGRITRCDLEGTDFPALAVFWDDGAHFAAVAHTAVFFEMASAPAEVVFVFHAAGQESR
jgi:hypothetical protein